MPHRFPWEIRGESAEEEAKTLRKKVKDQYQQIKDLEFTVEELKRECIKRRK